METIQAATRCQTEDDIKALIKRTKEIIGANYSVGGAAGYSKNIGELRHIVNADYPAEYMEIYSKQKLYEKDPVILWQFQNTGTQLWTDTYRMYKERLPKDLIARAADFNIRYGVSGGVTSPMTKTASIINFSGKKNLFGSHQKAIVGILVPHIHQALMRICMKQARNRHYSLTVREKEIIKWLSEGKSNWEIGTILKISERTAKFHVENISRKLNAVNRAHAVAIALEENLVN
ncbi:MAG: autoinducer binding domain-containing protein [Deltaproteobacteria bacterium]|nr:autoinducer binding domain-containing protein [Deltaproteobacteria bacterium]